MGADSTAGGTSGGGRKRGRPTGRPTELRAALRESIAQLLRGTLVSRAQAAALVGVGARTLERWLSDARTLEASSRLAPLDREKVALLRAVEKAEAERVQALSSRLLKLLRGKKATVKDLLSALARLDPANWSRRDNVVDLVDDGHAPPEDLAAKLRDKLAAIRAAKEAELASSEEPGPPLAPSVLADHTTTAVDVPAPEVRGG